MYYQLYKIQTHFSEFHHNQDNIGRFHHNPSNCDSASHIRRPQLRERTLISNGIRASYSFSSEFPQSPQQLANLIKEQLIPAFRAGKLKPCNMVVPDPTGYNIGTANEWHDTITRLIDAAGITNPAHVAKIKLAWIGGGK